MSYTYIFVAHQATLKRLKALGVQFKIHISGASVL